MEWLGNPWCQDVRVWTTVLKFVRMMSHFIALMLVICFLWGRGVANTHEIILSWISCRPHNGSWAQPTHPSCQCLPRLFLWSQISWRPCFVVLDSVTWAYLLGLMKRRWGPQSLRLNLAQPFLVVNQPPVHTNFVGCHSSASESLFMYLRFLMNRIGEKLVTQ